jgi:hypothetical protein
MLRLLWPATRQNFVNSNVSFEERKHDRLSTTHGESGDWVFQDSKPGTGRNVAELFARTNRTCQSWIVPRYASAALLRFLTLPLPRVFGAPGICPLSTRSTGFHTLPARFRSELCFSVSWTVARKSKCCIATCSRGRTKPRAVSIPWMPCVNPKYPSMTQESPRNRKEWANNPVKIS